jgi:23S rRNA G2445 N2-methylase RlmL
VKSQASAPSRTPPRAKSPAPQAKESLSEELAPKPSISAWPNRQLDASDMVTAYAIANPGLEELVEDEVRSLWPSSEPKTERGGVNFQLQIGDLQARLAELRIATRVLIRVAEFTAKDFPKLHKRTLALAWSQWLATEADIKVKAASQASRLKIKKRIEEVVAEAITEARGQRPRPAASQIAQIYVRVDQDRVMISADACGELMHKRGDREDVGRAPLRETWAAAVVQRLRGLLSRTEKSTWMWIEPMAGTAVFAREWRADRPKRDWALGQVIRVNPKSESELTSMQAPRASAQIRRWCFADSNPARRKALAAWLAGESSISIADSQQQLATTLLAETGSADATRDEHRVIVVNPPWGVRLQSPEAVNTRSRQVAFLEGLEQSFRPAVVAVVFPRTREGLAGAPAGWRELKPLQFKVGGLPVVARFFEVKARLPR